jgi:predicted NAD-dependent protein-ADP-ribosyltransferase YbiA (DUF1768 family)
MEKDKKNVVISFTKVDMHYGWLGNMSPFKVNYKEKEWLTIEALFQSLRFDDDEIKEIIRNEKSPMGAKMKAKSFKNKLVVVSMSEKDVENMKMCVRLKVEQNKILKEKLLKTKEFEIIEDIGSRNGERHLFWGAKKINGEWIGNNMMGRIWMEIREELKKEETNS